MRLFARIFLHILLGISKQRSIIPENPYFAIFLKSRAYISTISYNI